MAGNDTDVEPLKASEMSSDWLINGNNISNASSEIIRMDASMVEVSSCPSTPMVDSFCPPIWDQPINGHSLGYCNMNVPNDPSTSSSLGHERSGTGWIPNAVVRDSMFLPTVSRMLPHSLPPFSSDSAFIERAARFSCFNGGNISEMANPFGSPHPLNPHSRAIGPIQGPNENEKESKSFVQARDEAINGVNMSNIQCDEAEFSGCDAQEELVKTAEESSGKGIGFRKRKRIGQKTENNEASQPDADASKEKGDQNPSSTSNHGWKNGKQESQGSDPPKEDYIHVRARRGQATNSHSLAERIRREKISERMKLLQDLVPGCSKVTGKAVMLDEIINYVQSLQRQVEFLSMKLSTVNPQLDFNMEGFLAKDIVQSRAGLSSSLAFPPDIAMPFPPLHLLQPGLNQVSLQSTRNSSETLQRSIGLDHTIVCGGLCEPTSRHMQAAGVWEDELHNVVRNGFNSNAHLNAAVSSDHMKAEP